MILTISLFPYCVFSFHFYLVYILEVTNGKYIFLYWFTFLFKTNRWRHQNTKEWFMDLALLWTGGQRKRCPYLPKWAPMGRMKHVCPYVKVKSKRCFQSSFIPHTGSSHHLLPLLSPLGNRATEWQVTVRCLLSGASEEGITVFLLDNGLSGAIGADERGLMLRVMHVNVTGTAGLPTGVLWDYLSQNICILPSENGWSRIAEH